MERSVNSSRLASAGTPPKTPIKIAAIAARHGVKIIAVSRMVSKSAVLRSLRCKLSRVWISAGIGSGTRDRGQHIFGGAISGIITRQA